MEPGPALFFTAEQLRIAPEPPLDDSASVIDTSGLAPIAQELAAHETTLRQAVTDLTASTFGLHERLNVAESEMSDQLASREAALPLGLTAEIATVTDFLDGAESSLPPEAYTEIEEPYVPPPELPEPGELTPRELE
jgi:hypothetical protein